MEKESVGLIAAQWNSQHFVNGVVGGQTGQTRVGGKKTWLRKIQKMEKYHLPELRRIIICSSHNDLQYSGQNGSHFKITK